MQIGGTLRRGLATKIGEGNMSFNRTVLVTAVFAALTSCAGTGDKKPDAVSQTAAPSASAPATSSPVAPTSAQLPGEVPAFNDSSLPDASSSQPVISVDSVEMAAPAPAVPPMEKAELEPAKERAPAAEQKVTPRVAPPAALTKPTNGSVPSTVTLGSAAQTFNVTVENKEPNHPNFGRGATLGFVVDGQPGKELALSRGVTYTFAVRTGLQHDFYFTTSPIGHGAGTVTEGVVGQFIYNGDAQFIPAATTPPVLYYACRNHKYMGGKIHVGNAGEKVVLGAPDDATEHKAEEVKRNVTPEQVKQKLNFADMMIGASAAAKRVTASDNAEAKQLATQAKQELANARAAMNAGKSNGAMAAVDEALRLMHSATTLVPDEAAAPEDKARYTSLLEQIRGFEASYQRNLANAMKPKSGAGLDKNKFSHMMSDAESLAGKGQYGEAVKRLESANELLTAALTAMLDSQTVVYEKNFTLPKDEYEYELSRYKGYAELIPVALEQRQPMPQTVAMMNELTKRAEEIHDEALGLAKKSDYKMAIMALQAATERVQKALRLAGVQ